MEGKINQYGNLEIKRHGVFKRQFCPYNECPCGDGCPLFSEYTHKIYSKECHKLYLCKRYMSEFIEIVQDDREGKCHLQ
jgi:hypothetical protein